MEYKIGLRFKRANRKADKFETIIDILKTTNNAGELVKIRYVASHELMGQVINDYDVTQATTARALDASKLILVTC